MIEYNYKDQNGNLKRQKSDMINYMQLKHKQQIRREHENQPLLFVNYKDQVIYLPPSLCYRASLPDDFTKDSKKMKDIAGERISNPQERYDRIQSLSQKY